MTTNEKIRVLLEGARLLHLWMMERNAALVADDEAWFQWHRKYCNGSFEHPMYLAAMRLRDIAATECVGILMEGV